MDNERGRSWALVLVVLKLGILTFGRYVSSYSLFSFKQRVTFLMLSSRG